MSFLSEALQDKDNKKAYALTKKIAAESAESDEYYCHFEEFAGMLTAKSSYVRTRGFILCCAQAQWDKSGKLERVLSSMLVLLHDEKPTVVRQCLGALHEVLQHRPGLHDAIKAEVESMNIAKYQDSMASLIQKDRNELLKQIG